MSCTFSWIVGSATFPSHLPTFIYATTHKRTARSTTSITHLTHKSSPTKLPVNNVILTKREKIVHIKKLSKKRRYETQKRSSQEDIHTSTTTKLYLVPGRLEKIHAHILMFSPKKFFDEWVNVETIFSRGGNDEQKPLTCLCRCYIDSDRIRNAIGYT